MVEHAHGNVCDVCFISIFRLPARIEELGIDLHVWRAEFVCQFLPAFHTVLVRPQPNLPALVDERLHALYLQKLQTATSQPKLVLRLTKVVRHDECRLLRFHEIYLRLLVSLQQVTAKERLQDGVIVRLAHVSIAFLIV